MRNPLLLVAACAAAAPARADEPQWTEGRRPAFAAAGQTRPDFVKLAESLGPAVVYIAGRTGTVGEVLPSTFRRRFENEPGSGKSVGTGFIIHKSGTILTNYHV